MVKDLTSVIIVTYNSGKYILDCLNSLKTQEGLKPEIIIVDNNSSDNTIEKIKQSKITVNLVCQDKNLGFAKANNIGVNESQGQYIIFLNPDTELTQKDTLFRLKKSLSENPQFAIIGPQLILTDGNIQKSVRNLPSVARAFKEYILSIRNAYSSYLPKCKSICEVESIVGACIIINRKNFDKLGKFNEKYFLYFEDLELCRQAQKKGLKIGYLPEIKVKHKEGASGINQNTYKLLHDSAKRYHGLLSYYLIQFITRAGDIFNLKRDWIILLVSLANFWIWRILNLNIPVGVLLIIISWLLYSSFLKNNYPKATNLLLAIIFAFLSLWVLKTGFDRSITISSTEEIDRMNQRHGFYANDLGNLYQNRLSIYYYTNINPVIFKIKRNFFYNLDPNLYFFASHPRERAEVGEFDKYPPFYLPLFIIGILSFIRKSITRVTAVYFIGTVVISTLIRPAYNLGPVLLFPVINVIIASGLILFLQKVKGVRR